MNFDLSDEQHVISDLAATIFTSKATPERVKRIERGDAAGFDGELWKELTAAGLLALCLPESEGGSGKAMVELALVATQQGRWVAPVPLVETIVTAMAIARWASPDLRSRVLSRVVAGDTVVTSAVTSPGTDGTARPSSVAAPDGDGYRLRGSHPLVPAAQHAGVIVVPATVVDGSVALFAVDPVIGGVTVEAAATTDRRPHAHVTIDAAVNRDSRFGDQGAVTWLKQRLLAAHAAVQLGVCEGSLRLTAEHVSTREQFGRPLATLQAVGQRIADSYVTTEALRVTSLNAAWRLDHDLDATSAVLVAAWWAAEGGQQVVLAGQHLHGGIGADVDYPVHRYFLWASQLANSLGTASAHLAHLGAVIAGREDAR